MAKRAAVLKNRDAIAYAAFRWADIHGRPMSYDDAQEIVREMEIVCPKLSALVERPWSRPQKVRFLDEDLMGVDVK